MPSSLTFAFQPDRPPSPLEVDGLVGSAATVNGSTGTVASAFLGEDGRTIILTVEFAEPGAAGQVMFEAVAPRPDGDDVRGPGPGLIETSGMGMDGHVVPISPLPEEGSPRQ